MTFANTTASIDTTPSLTWEKLVETWNTIRPVLYYATETTVERGQILLCKEPEFFLCHPDDLDGLREQITHRRLVHLRDRPPPTKAQKYQDCLATTFGNFRAFTR